MMPPTSYCIGEGHEIELPAQQAEGPSCDAKVHVAIGCGHAVLLSPSWALTIAPPLPELLPA